MDDQVYNEHKPLLNTKQTEPLSQKIRPDNPSGSFSTLLHNIQCLNLVSVSVNVSTNHEDDRNANQEDADREDALPEGSQITLDDTRVYASKGHDTVKRRYRDFGIPDLFSTLLRSFQIFNLVSVLVNVSTYRKDERKQDTAEKNERKVPDYYQAIFGREDKGEKPVEKELQAVLQSTTRYLPPSKIPILFRNQSSDQMEAFTISISQTYEEISAMITDLATSSPNCISGTPTHALDRPKVLEIDVEWNIGDKRDWPKRTRLTEKNCEAVLLLMERGMMGILDVRLGETDAKEVRELEEGELKNNL